MNKDMILIIKWFCALLVVFTVLDPESFATNVLIVKNIAFCLFWSIMLNEWFGDKNSKVSK